MGYRCPVCDDPQADDTHLANHLAFTAIARGGDHEAWLDEHVPDWGSMDEATLGEAVVDLADEDEYPQVFEDTTTGPHDHSNTGSAASENSPRESSNREATMPERRDLDIDEDNVDSVIEEAIEMTANRREDDDESENE